MAYQINTSWKKKVATISTYPIADFLAGIKAGDRSILGKAITCIESKKEEDKAFAKALINACLPHSGNAKKIGITGAPGVGKSTFIETLGVQLLSRGHRVAVLAIDPSSQSSGGSILGDKTRMAQLAAQSDAFVRPSAAGETLGGVARKTREAIVLCEAAGYDIIFVETVGVGQSEIAVHSMVDCFVLLLLPGAGDELQGIKRGVVEMANFICIHKADETRLPLAKEAQRAYRTALHYFPTPANGWQPEVWCCSSTEKEGITDFWERINQYFEHLTKNEFLLQNRQEQSLYWLEQTIEQELKQKFYRHPSVASNWEATKAVVLAKSLSPFDAAEQLLEMAFPSLDKKQ